MENINNDYQFLASDVPLSKIMNHSKWQSYLYEIGNRGGVRILEIGSREVTGGRNRNKLLNADYVGFDYYAGNNVDVVGDVHKLSSYFRVHVLNILRCLGLLQQKSQKC